VRRKALRLALHLLCAAPLAWMTYELLAGRIRGEWIKEITHRTGFWGLTFITLSLAVTPLRRLLHWNRLVSWRRMLGLWGFAYICVHFLVIYLVLDKFFDWHDIVKDVAKRPYITVGFTGFLMLIPIALTSTRGWIRRLGARWTQLHALVYAVALAGVVHFMWSVKADVAVPTRFAVVLAVLLALRLVPRGALAWRPWTRAVSSPLPLPGSPQVSQSS